MSQYFTRTFRVDWSEANANGQVHLAGYFRYVMETAWEWGAAVGLGIADSKALGLGWVVRETQITLFRPLCPDDVFELTIWVAHWRRVHGTRYFELVHEASGEVVAQGAQEVVSLEMKNMRPVAIPGEIIERLTIEHPRVVPHRKFPVYRFEQTDAFTTQRTVHWQDLDAQEHVNNANYAAFAEDAAVTALAGCGWSPQDFKAQWLAAANRGVHIQYLAPASWGETLNLYTFAAELTPEGGVWYVEIERAPDREAIARCLIVWGVVDVSGRGERRMPESLFSRLGECAAVARQRDG